MSNLKLPTMTFAHLSKMLPDNGKSKTIAYATTARFVRGADVGGGTDDYVEIQHHGTVIAEVSALWVFVSNEGYTSSTTRGRIHAVLSDNGDYGVCQRKGTQTLIKNLRGERVHVKLEDEYSVTLRRDDTADAFTLATLTGAL